MLKMFLSFFLLVDVSFFQISKIFKDEMSSRTVSFGLYPVIACTLHITSVSLSSNIEDEFKYLSPTFVFIGFVSFSLTFPFLYFDANNNVSCIS